MEERIEDIEYVEQASAVFPSSPVQCRKLTEEWIQVGICESYLGGTTMRGIQEHLEKHNVRVSLTTIRYHLKQRGIMLRLRGGFHGVHRPDVSREDSKELSVGVLDQGDQPEV